jgi:hypothetical protein
MWQARQAAGGDPPREPFLTVDIVNNQMTLSGVDFSQ